MKFHQTFIICLICCLFSLPAKSQHSVGVIGGVNIPFVNFTDFVIDVRYNSAIMTTGYGGISYRYQNHKNVGIQIDLAYSQKGWGQNLGDTANVNVVKNTIDYIELPVYMRWTVLGESKFNIVINLGCFAAYAVNSSTTIENDLKTEDIIATYDLQRDNRGDFGFLIGLGISYEFNFGYLQLEGGYKSGFGNILPVSEIKKENPIVSTNQTPTLLLSYQIPLKKFRKKQ